MTDSAFPRLCVSVLCETCIPSMRLLCAFATFVILPSVCASIVYFLPLNELSAQQLACYTSTRRLLNCSRSSEYRIRFCLRVMAMWPAEGLALYGLRSLCTVCILLFPHAGPAAGPAYGPLGPASVRLRRKGDLSHACPPGIRPPDGPLRGLRHSYAGQAAEAVWAWRIPGKSGVNT